ncbi:hypothetical protein LCGC14_2821220, partial [marine sediment metagenome]
MVSATGCRTPCLYRYPVVSATGRFINVALQMKHAADSCGLTNISQA